MDDTQSKVITAIFSNSNALSSRNKLKAVLSDYLMDDKKSINMILSAYDEDVCVKFSSSNDITLTAMKLADLLTNDYGYSKDLALWSIQTWLYIFKYDEAASVLSSFMSSLTLSSSISKNQLQPNEIELSIGMFKGGGNMEPGGYDVFVIWDENAEVEYNSCIYLRKGFDVNKLELICEFRDRTYLEIAYGEYIYLNSTQLEDIKSIKAIKLS